MHTQGLKSLIAARTIRFHTSEGEVTQNLADHQWGVTMLLLDIWPDSDLNVVRAALDHDLPEHILGDLPHMAKVNYPSYRAAYSAAEEVVSREYGWHHELTSKEKARIRFCDVLEGWIFSKMQMLRGNTLFRRIVARSQMYLDEPFRDMDNEDKETCNRYFAMLKADFEEYSEAGSIYK